MLGGGLLRQGRAGELGGRGGGVWIAGWLQGSLEAAEGRRRSQCGPGVYLLHDRDMTETKDTKKSATGDTGKGPRAR